MSSFIKLHNKNKSNNVKHTYSKNLVISFLIIVIICTIPVSLVSYKFITDNLSIQASEYNKEILSQVRREFKTRFIDKANEISLNILYDLKDNANLSNMTKYPISGYLTRIIDVKDYIDKRKIINNDFDLIGINFPTQDVLVTSKFIRVGFFTDKASLYNGELQYFKGIINSSINSGDNRNYCWIVDENYPYYFISEKRAYPLLHFIRNYSVVANNINTLNASIILCISYKRIEEMLMSILSDRYNDIIIADREGKIVYHKDINFVGKNAADLKFFPEYGRNSKSSYINNEKYEVSRLNDNEWTYIISTPISDLENVMAYVLKVITIIVILTMAFGLFLSVIMAKKLSTPIDNIILKWKHTIDDYNGKYVRSEISFIEKIIDIMFEKMTNQAQRIKDSYPIIKSNFLRELVSGKLNNKADIEEKLTLLGYTLQHKEFFIVIIKSKLKNLLEEYETILGVMIEDYYKNSGAACISSIIDNQLVLFFNTCQSENELSSSILSIISYNFNENNFIAAVSAPQLSITSIRDSYEQAKLAIKYCYFHPEQSVFIFTEVNEAALRYNFNGFLVLEFKDKLTSCDIDQVIELLKGVFYELKSKYPVMKTSTLAINEITEEIKRRIGTYNLTEDFEEFIEYEFDISSNSNKLANIIELEAYIMQTVKTLFEKIEDIRDKKYYGVMEQAIKYICINLSNPQLSLENTSDCFGMSPNYFSRQFRKITGKSFIKFVSEKKIEEVKRLLSQTDYKLDVISEIVGYSTPQYLINKFKLECGITPSEYRMQILHTAAFPQRLVVNDAYLRQKK